MRAVTVKELKHWFRYPTWILVFVSMPYMFTGMTSMMGTFVGGSTAAFNFAQRTGTSNFFLYQMIGAALWMLCLLVIVDIGQSLREEQLRGTFEQNFLAPVRMSYFLVSLTVSHFVLALIIFFASLIPAIVYSGTTSALELLQALSILFLGVIPLYGIGFAYSSLVVKLREPQSLNGVLIAVFGIITGTYYPITLLPAWVQLVGNAIPNTHVNNQLREILIFNNAFIGQFGGIAILTVMAFLYPTLGYGAYRMILRNVKRGEGLAKY
jgi:ABC-2 type transport system permease protein